MKRVDYVTDSTENTFLSRLVLRQLYTPAHAKQRCHNNQEKFKID